MGFAICVPLCLFGLMLSTAESTAMESTAMEAKRMTAASEIASVLESPSASTTARWVELQGAARKTIATLGRWHQATQLLETALEESTAFQASDRERSLSQLERALRDSHKMLIFEPYQEASMPDGFPELTPVGAVELKSYPTYRMARTTMSGENSAFWTLFMHIKQNNIAMTAPVEMTYPRKSDPEYRESTETMAFLYGPDAPSNPDAGAGVEIVTVEPLQVVSVGQMGRRSMRDVAAAKQFLEAWLRDQRPDLKVVGGVRVLGYNGPSVPTSRRYFEIQLQVEPNLQRASF